MPGLLTIPRELQLQIAEYVSEHKSATLSASATNRDQLGLKTDQKNLCLVCKEIRDLATPILYRDMVIHVNKLSRDFQRVISKDHRGLPHVRTLLVVNRGWEERMWSPTDEILLELLSALPRDLLIHVQ